MKLLKMIRSIIIVTVLGTMVLQSCKKTISPGTMAVASLNIVNALPTSVPLIPVIGTTGPVIFNVIAGVPQYGSYQSLGSIGSVSYASNVVLTPVAGNDTVYLAQKNSDTLSNGKNGLAKYMFNSVLPLKGNTVFSLFITGKDTTTADYLFVQDTLPYHPASDSSVGIRFVNLSANSSPISINIKTSANGSEVGSLVYKGITSFKNYAATSAISSYIFEFRDAGTGTLLTSYTLAGVNAGTTTVANTVRFKNLTIALIGQPTGGTVAQKCILINNY